MLPGAAGRSDVRPSRLRSHLRWSDVRPCRLRSHLRWSDAPGRLPGRFGASKYGKIIRNSYYLGVRAAWATWRPLYMGSLLVRTTASRFLVLLLAGAHLARPAAARSLPPVPDSLRAASHAAPRPDAERLARRPRG